MGEETGTTVAQRGRERKREEERGRERASGKQNEQLDPGSYCLFVFVCVWGTVITAARSYGSMYMCIRVCVCVDIKALGGSIHFEESRK